MYSITRNQVIEAVELLNKSLESIDQWDDEGNCIGGIEDEKRLLTASGLIFEAHKSNDLRDVLAHIWLEFHDRDTNFENWREVEIGLNSGLIDVDDLIIGFRQGAAISA